MPPTCPLGCGAHVWPENVHRHFEMVHPENHVHLLPQLSLCPHLSIQPVILGGPPPMFGVPLTVN